MMPVHRLGPNKWRWGSKGKVYPTKAQADRQRRAIQANKKRKGKK